jgi:hypothetical protein
MVIRVKIETWVIGKGSNKSGGGRGWIGEDAGGCWVLWTLCVLGCFSTVVVEGACVRDCWGPGVV